jgi:hypothetical protein
MQGSLRSLRLGVWAGCCLAGFFCVFVSLCVCVFDWLFVISVFVYLLVWLFVCICVLLCLVPLATQFGVLLSLWEGCWCLFSTLGDLGAPFGHPGVPFGHPLGTLGCIWAPWAPFGRHLDAIWAPLGSIWASLGAILGSLYHFGVGPWTPLATSGQQARKRYPK